VDAGVDANASPAVDAAPFRAVGAGLFQAGDLAELWPWLARPAVECEGARARSRPCAPGLP